MVNIYCVPSFKILRYIHDFPPGSSVYYNDSRECFSSNIRHESISQMYVVMYLYNPFYDKKSKKNYDVCMVGGYGLGRGLRATGNCLNELSLTSLQKLTRGD